MTDDIEENDFEESDDDFEGGDDIGSDDIVLDDLDDDDDEGEDEETFSPKKRKSGASDADDLLESNYEQAVKANPKRQSVQRKRARTIEGILDTAELSTEEGMAKAWQALQNQTSGAKVRKYSFADNYTENDVIAHPSFGEGYVVEILTATKISVLFEGGLKRLAHNK